MDTLWTEIIKQVPSLAVLCFIVVQFLKSMKSRDEMNGNMMEKIEHMHRESAKSINENTRVIGRACEVIEGAAECIKDITHNNGRNA